MITQTTEDTMIIQLARFVLNTEKLQHWNLNLFRITKAMLAFSMKFIRTKIFMKIAIVLFFVVVVYISAVYFLLSARRDSIEAGHQGMIRYVVGIQSLFYEREGGYAGSWEQLRDDLIANGTEIPKQNQYRYTLEPAGDSLNGKNGGIVYENFICIAEPIEYGENGIRSFFVDSTGVIRYEVGKTASKYSDPI